MSIDDVRKQQVAFFSHLFEEHKDTPYAVASESQAHKMLRYERLCRIFAGERNISVHDIGMGMGHLYEYIRDHHGDLAIQYSGTEIVKDYYDHCVKSHPGVRFYLRDLLTVDQAEQYDYVLISGVFHQMRENQRGLWEQYMFALLAKAFQMARRGIAFNVVSEHVDFYQPAIYYCNLTKLMYFIVDHLSRFFSMDHAYALFEATVFVFHQEHIRARYPDLEFRKYFREERAGNA